MGVLTGIGGGVLRDLLTREPTLLTRRELFMTPILVGVLLYVAATGMARMAIAARDAADRRRAHGRNSTRMGFSGDCHESQADRADEGLVNQLSDPDDMKAVIACLELCREIGNSAALQPTQKAK